MDEAKSKRAVRRFSFLRTKRLWILFSLLFTCTTVTCAGYVPFMRSIEQYILRNYSQPFLNYPLPPDTVEISHALHIDYWGGSQNYCTYVVSRTVQSSLSLAALMRYFAEAELPTPRFNTVYRYDMKYPSLPYSPIDVEPVPDHPLLFELNIQAVYPKEDLFFCGG